MFKEASVLLLLCFALPSTEPRRQQARDIVGNNALVSPNHPYVFFRVPGRRAGTFLQGFEDDDDYSNSDDAMINVGNDEVIMDKNDEDEEDDTKEAEEDDTNFTDAELEDTPILIKTPSNMRKNVKPQHISEEDADDVESAELGDAQFDSFIDFEAHTVIDTKTGELSLMVPRNVFEAIPGGSVITLMTRSFDENQARQANRVIVRRRRRRNGFGVNLNGSGGNRNNFRPGGNNAQRRVNANNNNNVRIIRQNVYGRPITQNFNRRPIVQPNNRRRVNFA